MKIISLGSFMNDAKSFKKFTLFYDDPLSPTRIEAEFDSIAVCLSACPYIAMKKNDTSVCLHHIVEIKKCCNAEKIAEYVIICNDYSADYTPYRTKYFIKILQ